MAEPKELLLEKHCRACEGEIEAMAEKDIWEGLKQLNSWDFLGDRITKKFTFRDYYQTTAFVNAIVWIAHQENHHPDVVFGYKTCQVYLTTHALGGVSENDFIVAAKIDVLSN